MQKPNQPPQQINYYVQYQPNNMIPPHLNQAHSNVQIYHKIQPQMNMNKINTEVDSNKSRGSFYEHQNQQITFRKDLGKNGSAYHTNTESSVGKYGTIDYTNPELNQAGTSRAMYNNPAIDNNALRNKSLLQVKRKQSNNASREIREQYYKNPHSQELLNKLPQLEFQHINKINTSRPYYVSPSSDLKARQQKKPVPPFNFQAKSSSFKDPNTEVNQTKKQEIEQNEQNRKKETIKFNSPTKVNNYPTSKTLKELEANRWINPYSEKGLENTVKKQYTPETSNSTSSTFETPVKPTSISYKQSYLNGLTHKNQNQNQPTHFEDSHIRERTKYIQINKKLEQNLEQQKNLNHQKQIRIKNLQNEVNTQKINFQKRLQSAEKDMNTKKQAAISIIKQQYEKQITKLNNQLSQKSIKQAKQIKQIENKYQASIQEVKKQIQKEKLKFKQVLEQQQRKMADRIIKNLQLQKANQTLQNKIKVLEEELKKKNQDITSLSAKVQQSKQKIVYTKSIYSQEQQYKGKDNSIQQLIQKNRILQEKNSTYLANIDKSNQKYKQSKAELQRLLRKIEELNTILCQKDSIIRNMSRDMRGKDKFISQLKKNNQSFQKIIKSSNEQLIKLSCRALSQKYK